MLFDVSDYKAASQLCGAVELSFLVQLRNAIDNRIRGTFGNVQADLSIDCSEQVSLVYDEIFSSDRFSEVVLSHLERAGFESEVIESVLWDIETIATCRSWPCLCVWCVSFLME